MCNYLVKKFPNEQNVAKSKFRCEFRFIQPHLDKEIIDSYLQKSEVKYLLERENAHEQETTHNRLRNRGA